MRPQTISSPVHGLSEMAGAKMSRLTLLALIGLAVGSSAFETLDGIVTGAGYYVGCSVQIDLPSGYTPAAITKVPGGTFSVPCSFNDGSSCTGSVLRMGSEQGEGCRDSVTGLPVMFGLKAPLVEQVVSGGDVAVNPVTTLQAVLYQATKGAEWDQIAALVEEQLGLPAAAVAYKAGGAIQGAYNGDVIQGATAGFPVSLSFQAASAQLHTLVTVGASLLEGMLMEEGGPLTPDSVAEAVYFALGLQMAMAARDGTTVDLTNATEISQTLATAQVSLKKVVSEAAAKKAAEEAAAKAKAAPGPTSAPLAILGGRRLLRDTAEAALGLNSTHDAGEGEGDSDEGTVAAEDAAVQVTVQVQSMDGGSNSTQPEGEGEEGEDWGESDVGVQSMDDSATTDDYNTTTAGSQNVASSSLPATDEAAAPAPAPQPQPQPSPSLSPSPSPSPSPEGQSPEPEQSPPPPPEEPEDANDLVVDLPDLSAYGKVGVVASPIAILNEFTAEALSEGLKTGADPTVVLNVLGRIMAVAQMDVAPTARLLGEGDAEAGEFQAYDVDGLVKLVQSVPLA